MKLYAFQQAGADEILSGFKSHRTQCLSWYTGAGKTNVIAEVCRKLISKDPDVKIGISAYLTTEVRDQIGERLHEFGLGPNTHIVLGKLKHIDHKQITVFNPQAFAYTLPKITFDYLILDEAHSGVSESCVLLPKIIRKTTNDKTRILLVSATPWDTLAQKVFKGCRVMKRPLDLGLKDGLITDFKFHAEEASVEFTEADFSRKGDLRSGAISREMSVLKSSCIGKLENIVKKYDRSLGSKVLVICPPGNNSEIARLLAKRFGGLAFIMTSSHCAGSSGFSKNDGYGANLERFKSEADKRFLFVTNKCQVGFDYRELTSVIDLTMSRNIRVLAQRMGRIARKDGETKKHYFYVYDKSLMMDRLEWLLVTVLDFCLGAYDGWTTKTAKYRPVAVYTQIAHPISLEIKDIIRSLREPSAITSRRTLKFVEYSQPTKWSLEKALAKASTYSSRTEMWDREPGLYKWFRLNAKDEMDKHFPLKNRLGKWNEQTVIACMKQHRGLNRRAFLVKFSGCKYWLDTHKQKRDELLDKYFPLMWPPWTEDRVMDELKTIENWTDIRDRGGLRSWMNRSKGGRGEQHWKKVWMKMVPKRRAA